MRFACLPQDKAEQNSSNDEGQNERLKIGDSEIGLKVRVLFGVRICVEKLSES